MSSNGGDIGETDPTMVARSITFKKRNFTRQFNSLGKLTQFVGKNPTPHAVKEINSAKEKMHKAFGELMEVINLMVEIDPTYDKDAEIAIEENTERFEDMIQPTISVLKDIDRPAPAAPAAVSWEAAPAPTAGGGAGGPPKLMETLKPPVLTKDFTPIEYKSWVKKFRAYYSTGKVDKLDMLDQQAVWRICIDPNLEERIGDLISDRTPIFGAGSIMEYLDDEFNAKYPLTTRRADYFRLVQKEGQAFSDHMAKLLRISREADLGALGLDDLHCFRLISSVTDKKLREKFLKLENPTCLLYTSPSPRD